MFYSIVLIWWADSIVSTAIRLYSNQSSGYTVVNHAKRESGAEQNYSIIKLSNADDQESDHKR